MAQLRALIFDVDGTLADTERDGHRVAFNRAFAEAGLDWEWDVALYGKLLVITGGKERIRHYLDCYHPEFRRRPQLQEFIAALHQAKTRHYTMLMASGGVPLRTGVRRLLTEARAAGLRLAIATTTTPENVSALLENVSPPVPLSWFEVIAAGDVVDAKKPAPDIYHYVLQCLGLAPEQCLAFEDSENGVRAARSAGLTTLITTNDYTHDHDFDGARLVLTHLGEPDQPFDLLQGELPAAHQRYVDAGLLHALPSRASKAAP
jgi:beta-phosphoglucomutase-like phosphatase (HAD superfamily)